MGNLSLFMKNNKKVRENAMYPATKYLLDENGEPLQWEIQPISTRKNSEIREKCTFEVPSKLGMVKTKVNNTKYMAMLLAESVVYPDLYNKELQDSYGVSKPEDLIQEMIDDAGEYNNFIAFINEYNDITPISEKIEKAKN